MTQALMGRAEQKYKMRIRGIKQTFCFSRFYRSRVEEEEKTYQLHKINKSRTFLLNR